MLSEKKAQRERMLAQRRSLTATEREQKSQAMLERLYALPEFGQARSIFAYAAMPDEPDLDELLSRGIAAGRTMCLPDITGPGVMRAVRLRDMNDLVQGKFGIRSLPLEKTETVAAADVDLIVVPGAAFSPAGERLGLGGGYYDRYLPQSPARRVALAFDCQVLPTGEIVMEPHDARVDILITESRVVHCAGVAAS